jgi:integrase
MLIEEFFRRHVKEKLAPKTVERYHEQAACLAPGLLQMSINEITPLHLSREWKRLLECGGHHRRTREPRPLSAKTVSNIAGVLSSAFARAVKWGLVTSNPVPLSEPPVPKKRRGMALTPAQQRAIVAAATGPWCLPTFLEVCAGTGARRGEVAARSRFFCSSILRKASASMAACFVGNPAFEIRSRFARVEPASENM